MAKLIDFDNITTNRSDNPLVIYWPSEYPYSARYFCHWSEWRAFILELSLNHQVPEIISTKFERAQNLYLLNWICNHDSIKAGELAALVALEMALKDVYGVPYKKYHPKEEQISFLKKGLEYMVEHDGLTNEKIPMYQKHGREIIANLYRDKAIGQTGKVDQTGTLIGIRNSLAHGDPFEGLPWSGLLEVVRDLIEYIYRPKS